MFYSLYVTLGVLSASAPATPPETYIGDFVSQGDCRREARRYAPGAQTQTVESFKYRCVMVYR